MGLLCFYFIFFGSGYLYGFVQIASGVICTVYVTCESRSLHIMLFTFHIILVYQPQVWLGLCSVRVVTV